VNIGQKGVAFSLGDWLSHYYLGSGFFGLGQKREAIPEFKKAVEFSEGDTDPVAALAFAYAAVGNSSEAQKILGELQRQSKTRYVSPYMIGVICAGLGHKDRTFEFLEKSYDEKSTDLAYFIKDDWCLDGLRSDPRFAELLRRMALPH